MYRIEDNVQAPGKSSSLTPWTFRLWIRLHLSLSIQEILFLERRRALLKFLDLHEAMDNIKKWCDSADQHMDRDTARNEDPEQVSSSVLTGILISSGRAQPDQTAGLPAQQGQGHQDQ